MPNQSKKDSHDITALLSSLQEAMPNQEFFEKYPLYRKFKMQLPNTLVDLAKPALHMHCLVCKSNQTFKMINQYYDWIGQENPVRGYISHVRYSCASCERFTRHFLLKFDPEGEYVMKVGQEPAWEINPHLEVEKMLGPHADYYKKGLICESQSYGIGAFAYYRRIVEEVIDNLLIDIADLMTDADRQKYLAALEKVKKTTVTQDKIELVKDMLPPILRPDGVNPLSSLHGILSEGLHDRTDEQCIELAEEVREILEFLTNQISVTKKASSAFTNNMRKLLERKKRNAT